MNSALVFKDDTVTLLNAGCLGFVFSVLVTNVSASE